MVNSDAALRLNHATEFVAPTKTRNEILGFAENPTVKHSVSFDIESVATKAMAKLFAVAVVAALAANKIRLVDIELVLGRKAVITFQVPLHMKIAAISDSVKYAIYKVLRTIKSEG